MSACIYLSSITQQYDLVGMLLRSILSSSSSLAQRPWTDVLFRVVAQFDVFTWRSKPKARESEQSLLLEPSRKNPSSGDDSTPPHHPPGTTGVTTSCSHFRAAKRTPVPKHALGPRARLGGTLAVGSVGNISSFVRPFVLTTTPTLPEWRIKLMC